MHFVHGTLNAACAILAKWPQPGRVKTRLGEEISHEAATSLARAMLLDTARRVQEVEIPWKLFLDTESGEPPEEVEGFPVAMQEGESLAERVANAVQRLWESEGLPVAVLGTDSPNFPEFYLLNACYQLNAGAPSVLGPTYDGGVYLLGFGRPPEGRAQDLTEILSQAAWETENLCADLTRLLEPPWGPPMLLDPWYDVDTVKDLERLGRDLKDPRSPGRFPLEVHRWLRDWEEGRD